MAVAPIANTNGTAISGDVEATPVTIGAITDGPFAGIYELSVSPADPEAQVRVILTREAVIGMVIALRKHPDIGPATLMQ